MELKHYQKTALDELDLYLADAGDHGPKHAFIGVTESPYKDSFFPGIPFVCIKIPTGGGKTMVAVHSIERIMSSLLQYKLDRGIVMWFTPSDAIKSQTIKKLGDRKDDHRKILDEAFENRVKIFSNETALGITKEDIEDNLCVIISSLDAFRKQESKRDKYKVYQENGDLINHFSGIVSDEGLDKDEEGTVIFSLVNVIKNDQPLVIIDEGHRAQGELSIDFIANLNPSFIIEYTATPKGGSNILINIPAARLKEEQMVKIPIVLESRNDWEQCLESGVKQRDNLEKVSNKNKDEYIRPIALVQAQPQSKTTENVTVEIAKQKLLSLGIAEEEIAIKTSGINQLENEDLFSPKCKIRYIITVNALAEGWDCSFAYVLISLANIGSKIVVEQVIGRIIRMPYAKRKNLDELNRCYVFASAKNFQEAAGQIIAGLETNGYSRDDIVAFSDSIKDPLVVTRNPSLKIFSPPMMALGDKLLTFEELIGPHFELGKQNAEFSLTVHPDSDGRATLDIEGDHWVTGKQQSLNLPYAARNPSEEELIAWLDKKLRFTILGQSDKRAFIEKAIRHQLKSHKLGELSIWRHVLADHLSKLISRLLMEHSKESFRIATEKGDLKVSPFESFPDEIYINQSVPKEFNKNYYDRIDKLNKEELYFVERMDLDSLTNIDFWIRNREKKDPFYIQGWQKNKFYPDFIAVTKRGIIAALEWKGEDRLSNDDTAYKEQIGRIWEGLGKGNHYFAVVHNGNIEEILGVLQNL